MRQVCVTGLGVVTPIGVGSQAMWDGLMSGRSGAGPITGFDAASLPVRIACEVPDFDPAPHVTAREAARLDRFAQMAVHAAGEAYAQAGLNGSVEPERAGAIVGSGIGGLRTIVEEHSALIESGPRGVSPFMVPKLMPNGAAAAIAMKFGLAGPNFAPASACATGAHAIGEAARCVEAGLADVMLAGGSEAAITPLAVAAFARMGALSGRNDDPLVASRPFDSGRDGFVFGEGAGILVLESRDHADRRGAEVLAEITGYAATCDAHHATQPDPEGRGATRAMLGAMKDAGIGPPDVDHVNAHGTSTPFNDRIETHAIKAAFEVEAKRVPVSSTKSQMGHLLGAAGAVEAGICVLALQNQVVPGTINLTDPDPDCDLDHVSDGPREADLSVVMSNSFGFGGQNACLIVSRS
ncbi:MAG: beta-ketoacyl-ACP synthase II [Actinomycetota bacterium]